MIHQYPRCARTALHPICSLATGGAAAFNAGDGVAHNFRWVYPQAHPICGISPVASAL